MAIVKVTDSNFDENIQSGVKLVENPSTAAKYEVMSIPTLIVFKDGEAVDKVVGFQPKENLAEVLDKHL